MFFLVFIFVSKLSFAEKSQQPQALQQQLPDKVTNIINALSFNEFYHEKDFAKQLSQSCSINRCDSHEKKKLYEIGKRLVHCQIQYLESLGVYNKDAVHLCRPQQAMLTCDSLATPLMRKMCYTANRYSLKVLNDKESQFGVERKPASH